LVSKAKDDGMAKDKDGVDHHEKALAAGYIEPPADLYPEGVRREEKHYYALVNWFDDQDCAEPLDCLMLYLCKRHGWSWGEAYIATDGVGKRWDRKSTPEEDRYQSYN
jgi:hypothetical protein